MDQQIGTGSRRCMAEWLPPGSCHLKCPGPLCVRRDLAPSAFLVLHSMAWWPLLTAAVMAPAAPGVGDLGAVGEDTPAVAGAPIALKRHIVAVLVAFGPEHARVDGRDAADLLLALGQY